MSGWKLMSDNSFPWPHKDVIIVAFAKDAPQEIEIFRCRCGEHGAYFPKHTAMISLIETGWIPFAFRDDDAPARDDEAFPPMWTDYLTETIT